MEGRDLTNCANNASPILCRNISNFLESSVEYEVTFEKFAVNGVIRYKDIKEYFKACGHFPSQKEIDDAIAIATKGRLIELIS